MTPQEFNTALNQNYQRVVRELDALQGMLHLMHSEMPFTTDSLNAQEAVRHAVVEARGGLFKTIMNLGEAVRVAAETPDAFPPQPLI